MSRYIQRASLNLPVDKNKKYNMCFERDSRLANYDYMGSVEFEFGTLPKAMSHIALTALGTYETVDSHYVLKKLIFDGITDKLNNGICLWLYDLESQFELHSEFIKKLAKSDEEDIRLKEACRLYSHFLPNKSPYSTVNNDWYLNNLKYLRESNFWIDIGDNYIFFIGGEDVAEVFKTTITEEKERLIKLNEENSNQ